MIWNMLLTDLTASITYLNNRYYDPVLGRSYWSTRSSCRPGGSPISMKYPIQRGPGEPDTSCPRSPSSVAESGVQDVAATDCRANPVAVVLLKHS